MRSIITLGAGLPRLALGTLALFGLVGGSGCGSIEPVAPQEAPITDPTKLYAKLTLNHPAVNLDTIAPYNTVQLTATPRDALGNPMPGLPAPTYSSADTTKAQVTSDGVLTAVGLVASPGVRVIATLTAGGVTYADTAMVVVRNLPSPPVLASLSIDPVPPDSGIWPVGGVNSGTADILLVFAGLYPGGSGFVGVDNRVLPRLLDTAGASVSISPMVFEYQSLDPLIATINRRSHKVTTVSPGQVRIVAQAMAYGIAVADTATFTVTAPTTGTFVVAQAPTGEPVFEARSSGTVSNELRIRPYGIIGWENAVEESVDVTFEDPTNVTAPPDAMCSIALGIGFGDVCGVGAGNALVPPAGTGVDAFRFRQFPQPGVYPFSTSTGATGRVVVTTELD